MSDEKEEKIYLRTRIPKHIHRLLKIAAIDEQTTIEQIVAALIEEWAERRNKKSNNDL